MFLALASYGAVHAATFVVDRTDDVVSATACTDATPEDCSLRGAIRAANATLGRDTIVVPAGTYALTIPGAGDDAAASGDLDITDNLTLAGAGASTTTIAGAAGDRVLHVDPNGAGIDVSISGVTVQGGATVVISFVNPAGAGILLGTHQTLGSPTPSGRLTVSDSRIQGNASAGGGGGIANNAGSLTLIRTTVANNSAANGGGVANGDLGRLTLIDSTVAGNSAAGSGGGITSGAFDLGIGSTSVALTGSTVSGNTASGQGGGIARFRGTLAVSNSTISGNTAGDGGGLFNNSGDQSSNVLASSTIAGNRGTGFQTFGGSGGGVSNGGNLAIRNTLLAGNTVNGVGSDCLGTFTSSGYNLIEAPSPNFQGISLCAVVGDATGNLIGQAPRIGPLANNGGFTATHALLGDSPAIDGGNPSPPGSGGDACPVTEQRGFVRPQGPRCDIGAAEFLGGFAASSIVPNRAGNGGPVLVNVFGHGLGPGAGVRLVRGTSEIVGNPASVAAGGTFVTASFDLNAAQIGAWDVIVANPDGAMSTLAGAFSVESARSPALWVDVLGPGVLRAGRRSTGKYFVRFGNRGNVDALGVPLGLAFSPDLSYALRFKVLSPPARAGQVLSGDDWRRVEIDTAPVATGATFINIPLLLPVVPAGFAGVLELTLTSPASSAAGSESSLVAFVDTPYGNGDTSPWLPGMVAGAMGYVKRAFDVTVPDTLRPELEQYALAQLSQTIADGRIAAVAGAGSDLPVYSLTQLQSDLAYYALARTLRP
jgi:hypothetical protein